MDGLEAGSRDTIVALATPEGEAGLAVVRLSGPAAVAIARRLIPAGPGELVSHRARVARLAWPAAGSGDGATPPAGRRPGDPLDEAVVLPLLAPRSYTGEDTVELQCHGGRLTARRVVAACVAAGARPAAPGEFTRRAFLNGRLSLDQAEAVADLIHAENELAAGAALRQLHGGLRDELAAIETPLRELLADLEGDLEFADPDPGGAGGPAQDQESTAAAVTAALGAARACVDALLAAAPAARRLRAGVQVALAGPPNAGKSALFNALLARERAIVDHEPGTTRDVVTANLHHGGCLFVLHDTAGLREGGGRVEELGQARTRATLSEADIVLWLQPADQRQEAAGEDLPPLLELRPDARLLCVVTKSDLAGSRGRGRASRGTPATAVTSARTGEGVAALRDRLLAVADEARLREVAAQGWLLNERHRHALLAARADLNELEVALAAGAGEEIVATLLAGALARLGEISGRVFTERLLDEVFARFCVGK